MLITHLVDRISTESQRHDQHSNTVPSCGVQDVEQDQAGRVVPQSQAAGLNFWIQAPVHEPLGTSRVQNKYTDTIGKELSLSHTVV